MEAGSKMSELARDPPKVLPASMAVALRRTSKTMRAVEQADAVVQVSRENYFPDGQEAPRGI